MELAASDSWRGENLTELMGLCSCVQNSRDLYRDIVGNPFRPVLFEPEWRTSTVVALARNMYDNREFLAMPLLGDALQDASCENEDILNHCRSENAHVRGCWVVDVVMGKGWS